MESLPAQLSWKRCKCLQSSLFQSKIYQHDQIQRRYRTIFTTHYACRNADVNLICLQQRLTDSFCQTIDSLMASMGVRLTWLDCNLPITYLSIRQSMPCLMCKPLEHIWLISFVFGQFVIIIQTHCFRVSLKKKPGGFLNYQVILQYFLWWLNAMCKDDKAKLCLPQIQIYFLHYYRMLLGYTHY